MVNIPNAKLPSSSQHLFSQVPRADIPRASFKRNFTHKTTFDAGLLIPVYSDEVLPGDTFNVDATFLARISTSALKTPLMDNMYLDSFWFFVPNRLLWSNWEKFMGAQANPTDSTSYLVPVMAAPASTGYAVGTLSDYFGIPTGIPDITHVSLWHRAYNLCWNQWFRDQNLQNSVVVDLDDGPDDPADYVLLRRGKRHDYFTSCLPWPQKGPAVTIPIGSTAPVIGILGQGNSSHLTANAFDGDGTVRTAGYAVASSAPFYMHTTVADTIMSATNHPEIYADLSSATASSINSLRLAFQLQKLGERDARSGTRYCEVIDAHFGVIHPSHAVLQRPQYLGGSSSPLMVNPVAQTSESSATDPLGKLAGTGFGTSRTGFTHSFTEHGVLLCLVSARSDLSYQQGLHRKFSRRTKYGFYWPALSHIGEQAVLNQEIYCVNPAGAGAAQNAAAFGYQEAWAEYRYLPSQISGKFRSTYSTPLDSWHLSQKFTALPTLGSTFIQENPPMDRILAINTEPHFIFDSFFRVNAVRPMPLYSVPGLIDHF